MKFLLIKFLVLLGFSSVYANAAKTFQESVPMIEESEGGSRDCSGSAQCGSCVQGGSKNTAK